MAVASVDWTSRWESGPGVVSGQWERSGSGLILLYHGDVAIDRPSVVSSGAGFSGQGLPSRSHALSQMPGRGSPPGARHSLTSSCPAGTPRCGGCVCVCTFANSPCVTVMRMRVPGKCLPVLDENLSVLHVPLCVHV